MSSILYNYFYGKAIEKAIDKVYCLVFDGSLNNAKTILTDEVWFEEYQKQKLGKVYIKTNNEVEEDEIVVFDTTNQKEMFDKSTQTD